MQVGPLCLDTTGATGVLAHLDARAEQAGRSPCPGVAHSLPTAHHCVFNEVLIEDTDDPDDLLQPGMRVLVPCECGETPLDHLGVLEMQRDDALAALDQAEPGRALYHWAPTCRRKQIIRHGLRPHMRPTTVSEGWKAPVICFADQPAWAWALSGGMSYTPAGEWDLWQTSMDLLTDPVILPGVDRASGIYEVRTEHRVYKRDLWLVASRTKAAA